MQEKEAMAGVHWLANSRHLQGSLAITHGDASSQWNPKGLRVAFGASQEAFQRECVHMNLPRGFPWDWLWDLHLHWGSAAGIPDGTGNRKNAPRDSQWHWQGHLHMGIPRAQWDWQVRLQLGFQMGLASEAAAGIPDGIGK